MTRNTQWKRLKMDDLVLKVAELADPKLTVGSSDDKIIFEASCQLDPVLPSPSIQNAKNGHQRE